MSLELTTPCIPTSLSKTGNGYGQITVKGVHLLAHRLAYTLAYGEPPPGAMIRHLCGNRACVNPVHLVAGTHEENMQDRDDHGRTARGERHGCAKLTYQQVEEIKARLAAKEKGRAIAKAFGVHESTISMIKRGRIWEVSK